jgi:hypothetical protein
MRRMSVPFFLCRTHHSDPSSPARSADVAERTNRFSRAMPSMVIVSNSFDKDSLRALFVPFVSHRFTSGKDVAGCCRRFSWQRAFPRSETEHHMPAMWRKTWQLRNSMSLFAQLSLFLLSEMNLRVHHCHSYSSGSSSIRCLRVRKKATERLCAFLSEFCVYLRIEFSEIHGQSTDTFLSPYKL